MKKINYYINNGNFRDDGNEIIFDGGFFEFKDNQTHEDKRYCKKGMILFSDSFKEGTISYDIVFDETSPESMFGIILDYKNIDSKEKYYEIQIRNDLYGYAIYYWDGNNWDIKLVGGTYNNVRNNQIYHIKIELRGNIQKLYINDVLLYTYTNMLNVQGAAGIVVQNAFNLTISNIQIEQREPSAFAIMKFEKDFDELYNEVIVPQFKSYGYKTIRADECYTATSILQDIIREINDASIIIADITMDNPNVFYELGYAHALNKPTILLADKDKREKLPFDISGFRTIFYTNSIGGKKEIENTLKKFIESINR